MEQICIDSSVLGTEKHLILDEGYLWSSTVPVGSWHLSGFSKLRSDRCLDTLLKLNGAEVDIAPPQKFVSAMSTLASGSTHQLPWSLIMPSDAHRSFVKRLVNLLKETFPTLNRGFYESTWVPQSHVLRSLVAPRIDRRRFEQILEESGMNHRVVDGFKPGIDGFATPVAYDRFGTRTGRLTVQAGPNILTIKKQYRDMIVPSRPNGKIISLDFSALEARVLLYEAGGSCPDVDLYTHISSEVFGGSVDRKAAKGAVISELYGSSKAALGKVLGISGQDLDNFVFKVKSYFKTNELKKRVKDEFLRTGCITNRYGRRVAIEDPLDHIFVNSYAQSTGADVAFLGFSSIVRELESRPGVRPIFVLHDALILDVAPEDVPHILSIKDVKVPGYVQVFPIKPEIIG